MTKVISLLFSIILLGLFGCDSNPYGEQIIIGNAKVKAGVLEEARADFQKILEKEPQHEEAQLGMARIAEAEKNLPKAIEQYKTILSSSPKNAKALEGLGLAFLYQNDTENAQKTFETLRDLNPDDATIRLWLGKIALSQENLPLAENELRRVLDLIKDHPEALFHLGRVRVLQKDWVGARAAFAHLGKLFPEKAYDLYGEAAVLANEGSLEKSIEILKQAVEKGELEKENLKTDPLFAPLQNNPEFLSLLR